jgi:hypothetical protein
MTSSLSMSSDGSDVFFDRHEPRAAGPHRFDVYDARVGGGFAGREQRICSGEECRLPLSPPPDLPLARSATGTGSGNVKPPKKCRKGKRKVRRKGRTVCVKNKKKKAQKGKAARSRRASR